MSWEWEVLTAIVRFLFLLAPFLNVSKDFALKGATLIEAKEMAVAGSCRAMLVSFPAQLLLAILARASNTPCQTVRFLPVALYVVVGLLLAFGLFKIPTKLFRPVRVKGVQFIWFGTVTVLGVLAQIFGLERAVALICQN
jgi:hypothetical protein